MKPRRLVNLLGGTAVLALALGAAAQTNQTIPSNRPAPGTESSPRATPQPGTQNDRQIPSSGGNQTPAGQRGNPGQNTAAAAQPAGTASQEFPQKAAEGNLAEMQMGQLARQKGSTDAVRDYGKMLVDDHSASLNKIRDMVKNESVTIDTEISPKHQTAYDRLSALSGPEFDQAFAMQMVTDHREAIAEYERESTTGSSEPWRDFARSSLPTLNKHLEEAQKLASAAPAGAAPTSTSPSTSPTGDNPGTSQPDLSRDSTTSPTGTNDRDYGRPSPASPQPSR